jgi:DNA-binding MarR family transcriptional regulator
MSELNPTLLNGMMCAAGTLRRANRIVSRLYDSFLKPSGLKATQYTLLRVLSARGPLSVNQLATSLVMDRTTLARDLKPLERDGFVKTSIDSSDNRVRLAAITEQGRARLEQAQPLWQEAQKHMVQVLGEDRLIGLIEELKEVVAATKS